MNVRLESLSLRYFKGKVQADINFNYPETIIIGDNGEGKTTINDGWNWLLFGKDSLGRSVKTATSDGFELKTLDENNVAIPMVGHEVTGVLYCDNRKVTLRKIYREDWVKPRGALEAVLKGHTNVCYFDGVPVDMGEYNRRINDIIPEALFKLITNPLYYNSLHWQERRRILLNMSGEINDSEIAAFNPEFEQLLSSLEGKSLSDFKAKIAAEKAAINEECKKLPTKITTVLEGIPQADDWAAIEQEIKEKQSRLDEIDTAIADTTKGSQLVFDKIQQIQGEINKLKTKRLTAVQTAKAAEKDRVFDANQKRRELENEISDLRREINQVDINAERLKKERDSVDQKIKSLTTKADTLRGQWHAENAKEYAPGDSCLTCPVYGHICTDEIAKEKHENSNATVIEAFNTNKAEKLSEINKDGKSVLAQMLALEKEFKVIVSEINSTLEVIAGNEEILNNKLDLLKVTPIETEKAINADLLPVCIEIDKQISELEQTIPEKINVDNSELITEKRVLNTAIAELNKRLNKRDDIAKENSRIVKYKEEQQLMAQQIADIEAQEYKVMQFTKAKYAEVERRVNSKFKIAKFKMFNYTNDGNEVETCETLINGVPFTSANTAMQINAGLDIINAICEHHNYYAPIFIDRSESVTSFIETKSQIIKLIVIKGRQFEILPANV